MKYRRVDRLDWEVSVFGLDISRLPVFQRTAAEWGLRWLWDHPEVSTVACDLRSMEPRIFELYNDAVIYEDVEKTQFNYAHEQLGIAKCTQCGACMKACPKELAIMDWLQTAHQLLAGK